MPRTRAQRRATDGLFLLGEDALRNALSEFARVCRRMQSASAFDVAAYDWAAIRT